MIKEANSSGDHPCWNYILQSLRQLLMPQSPSMRARRYADESASAVSCLRNTATPFFFLLSAFCFSRLSRLRNALILLLSQYSQSRTLALQLVRVHCFTGWFVLANKFALHASGSPFSGRFLNLIQKTFFSLLL